MISPYHEGFFGVFKVRPQVKVSEWAQENRIIPPQGANEAGPWRNERTPYLVEIMDELSASSPTREVAFCKGSQIGATDMGVNWLLYLMDCVPGPVMAFQPDDYEAEIFSKQRLTPSIDLCPRLRRKVSDSKGRAAGDTILAKEFDGGYLFLRGAESPKAVAGKPIGNLYLDELDRFKGSLKNEGDPVALALRRIATFPRAKAFFTSTPTTLAQSKIWPLYQDSDRRVYEVPCPECGHYQQIVIERLDWEKGNYENVHLICSGCGSCISESNKTSMLAKGKWRATNPGHKRAGFHLSALYSPIGWLSWGDIARMYDEAEADEGLMIVFVNTVLGLPYEDKSEGLAEGYLARRVEKYEAQVPDGVLKLTMAVDVQNDRLEYEVAGWGEGEESWGIEYRVIRGDPSELKSGDPENPSVWEVLNKRIEKRFNHADGGDIGISCTVVDSGGSCTDTVYQYTSAKQRDRQWVFAIKGGSNLESPLMNKPSKKGKDQTLLYVLGVEKGKTLVHQRLKKEKPGPGYCHFPKDENTGYNKHVYAGFTAERLVTRTVKGRTTKKWERIRGRANEPFDLRVYGTAAARMRHTNWDELREMRLAMKGRGAGQAQGGTQATRTFRKPRRRPGGIKLAMV